MIQKTFEIELDIMSVRTKRYNFNIVQNDIQTNVFNITMYNGTNILNLSSVSSATLTFKKADNNVVQGTASVATPTSGIIIYTLGTNEISYPGITTVTVELIGSNDERLTSNQFSFNTVAELGGDDAVASTTEYSLLNTLVDTVEGLIEDTEEAIDNCEEAVADVDEKLTQFNEWRFKGAYSSETTYNVNNIVSYVGSMYICTATTTGNAPTNGSYWDLVIQSSKFGYLQNSSTPTSETDTMAIGINGYDKNEDGLLVFANSVYLAEDTDYTIDGTSENITKVSGNWESGSYFNFVVLKNASSNIIDTDTAINVKSYDVIGNGSIDDYGALNTLIESVGSTPTELYFPRGTYKIGTNTTFPSNIVLNLTNGAMLSPDSGKTVAINGEIKAGLYQIFTGNGNVSGAIKNSEVYPEWFGAIGDGTTDDTTSIQKALNFKNVNFSTKTYITDPLYLVSNSTIYMTPNTILKAKTGYGRLDCLLNIDDISNVTIHGNYGTIQMLRAEYSEEYNYAVSICGGSKIRINDLNSIDAGDGFYVGASKSVLTTPSSDVYISNCYADNNLRNGLSIVSGRNVNILGGKYSNSNGMNPQFGIDIEPNTTDDWMENINLIGVTTEGNTRGGLSIVPGYLALGSGTTNPVSVNVFNYKSKDDGLMGGIYLAYQNPTSPIPENRIYGEINIENVLIETPECAGFRTNRWNELSPKVNCRNIHIVNPYDGVSSNLYDKCAFVVYVATTDTLSSSGNIDFVNCGAVDNRAITLMQLVYYIYTQTSAKPINNIKIINAYGSGQVSTTNHLVNWTYGTGIVKFDNLPIVTHTSDKDISNYKGVINTGDKSMVFTLPLAANQQGMEYIVQNTVSSTLQISPQSSDTILQYGLKSNNDLVLRKIGDYVRLKSLGGTSWHVVEITGRISPLGYSAIPVSLYGIAVPSGDTWEVGDRVINIAPSVGQPKSWVCTVAGTPGTWVSEGNL